MTISTCMIGHNELQIFTVHTLVDITNTGITRYSKDTAKQRNQQRNWETILQAFGLRSLPVVVQEPVPIRANLEAFKFGEEYVGEHLVWTAKIGIETQDIYKMFDDVSHILKNDFDQIPVIVGLEETAKFSYHGFVCAGATKNIYFIIE